MFGKTFIQFLEKVNFLIDSFNSLNSSSFYAHNNKIRKLHIHSDSMFNSKKNKFKVEKLPGRGDGVVALRDFQPGDLIMEDHPMIVMPDNIFERDDPDYIERWLDKKINLLSCFDREKYFNLSDARSSDFDPSMNPSKTSLGIFYTNCMSFIENSAALFPTMAKTNHSCSPNAEFFQSSREYTQQLVATQSISKGEEITISYLHAEKEHSDVKKIRQKYLKDGTVSFASAGRVV